MINFYIQENYITDEKLKDLLSLIPEFLKPEMNVLNYIKRKSRQNFLEMMENQLLSFLTGHICILKKVVILNCSEKRSACTSIAIY